MNDTLLTVAGFSLIFVATTLGAALVFFFKKDVSDSLNAMFLGCAAGIMTAASVWSLLLPAIEGAVNYGAWSFVPAAVGFISGGFFLVFLDKCVSRFYRGDKVENGLVSDFKKPLKMFLAITIHNIPEGLAVGFAFGAATGGNQAALFSAFGLAFGIAIQNFPEGAVISMPMRAHGHSRAKSFLGGVLSGVVEPVGAVAAILLAGWMAPMLPYLLSFAAGAMIYVVVEELIPATAAGEHSNLGTLTFAVGFSLMMTLDVAL